MKARKIKGLDPAGSFADQAERIVAVRLDELCTLAPQALEPGAVEPLHDLRIAAKRLRYVLEITAPCFGPYARIAIKPVKDLQGVLGDIHDCDVALPDVQALLDERPPAEARVGLEALAAHLRARRERLVDRFRDDWDVLERRGFRARLELAIAERPAGRQGEEPTP